MNIREITIQDPIYKQTIDLRTQVISIPFGFPPPTKETPDSHIFVAEDNGELVGCAVITPSSDKTTIRARQVSVTPNRQKQGIGHKLMAKAEQVAKILGYDELRLFAHTGSHPFFLKLGYEVKGEWQTQENGLKTILMSKKL